VYLAAAGGKPPGFDSGLQSSGQFSLEVTNDQEPIWFFCKFDKHCGQGMVGAINSAPTGEETYDAYLAAAKALGLNQNTLVDSGPVMGDPDLGAMAVGSSSPQPSTTTSSSSSSSHLVANGFFALLSAAFVIALA